MEAMKNSWTDDRLDDFAKHVDKRFDEVDRRFDEVDRRFGEFNGRLNRFEDRMEAGLDRINGRIDQLHRAIWILGSGALVTFVVGFAGVIATR
jgi:hypothetical protein